MFGQRSHSAKQLATFDALYLHPTVRVHAFVTAQIRELCVRFEANFALKWLDATVYVGVLFQSGTRSKSFSAFGASVTARSDVTVPYVTLEIRWVRENLRAFRLLAILRNGHRFFKSILFPPIRPKAFPLFLPLDNSRTNIFANLRVSLLDDVPTTDARNIRLDKSRTGADPMDNDDSLPSDCPICN